MAGRQTAIDPPFRSDSRQRPKHEVAFSEARMRYGEATRGEAATVPGYQVEIEHTLAPTSAGAAAKAMLHPL